VFAAQSECIDGRRERRAVGEGDQLMALSTDGVKTSVRSWWKNEPRFSQLIMGLRPNEERRQVSADRRMVSTGHVIVMSCDLGFRRIRFLRVVSPDSLMQEQS
jgi:hypothetical protein